MMPILVVLLTCRPSWALVYLMYTAFYKHVAPLGLNAEPNSLPRQCWSRRGVSRFFIGVLRPIRRIRDSGKWDIPPLWG